MDRATHCPNCFQEPAPTPRCSHCGFDAASYLETNEILPLFTALAGGKYLVGRVLGQGGFGVVYAGWARYLKRRVAIKEFFPAAENPLAQRQGLTVTARPRYQATFTDWKGQFLREAELLAQFSHPRIVQVHDILEEHNTVYLIMERLDGQTLSEHLGGLQERGDQLAAGRALSAEDGQRLLHAALEALDALHGHVPPVLHRDLTPHNLFLVGDRIDGLKVLDFGLARLGERTQSAVSLAVRVGNPGFAAPEQLGLYPGAITPATDFYTLGATLYTALAGVAPPNAQQRCAQQPPQSLPLLPNVDPTLAQVIRACLELSPQQRPKSVTDIRQRLASGTIILPSEPEPEPQPAPPLSAPTPSRPEPIPPPTDEPSPLPLPQLQPAPQPLLTPIQWLLLLGTVVLGTVVAANVFVGLALGAFAFALWMKRPRLSPPKPEPPPKPAPESPPAPRQPSVLSRLWKKMSLFLRFVVGVFAISFMYYATRDLPFLEPQMVKIPGGCYQMGSPESEKDRGSDERQHRVCVQAFEIGKYEVTQGQWKAVMGKYSSRFDFDILNFWMLDFWNWDNYPVGGVSWSDMQAFLTKLNQKAGKNYRLPTEAEWEYACRSGVSGQIYCGGNDADQVAWHRSNSGGKTHPVGEKAANGFGLYDMSGNLSEWTCSNYAHDLNGLENKCANRDTSDPLAVRGGSWADPSGRSAMRGQSNYMAPLDWGFLGFRLARSL